MAARELVLDLWANLNHKAPMDEPLRAGLAPTWVGQENLRRITAYHLLDAYVENTSREHLRTVDADARAGHREYGDAALLVDRVVAGVLGDTITVAVEGADLEIPDAPNLPEPPTAPDDDDQVARRVFELQQERWQDQVDQAITDWERSWREQPALQEVQEALRTWADDELLEQKVWEGEHDAVGLGDGVYVLGWDTETRRPALQVYDPRTYFPVLDDRAHRRGFPSRVHLAWEEDRTRPDGGVEKWLRRITYELVQLAEPRPVPWSGDPTWFTCTLTDAEWLLQDADGGWIVDALAPSRAQYRRSPPRPGEDEGTEIRDLDLQIDFIPVIHDPGVPSGREHFGRSILARVLQLLDDVQATDSDLQAAAALAGTPMVGMSGKAQLPDTLTVEPGAVVGLGENGRMDVVDLSQSVESLRHVIADLLDRLAVNIQVPGEVVGRVDETGPESGFARLLKLGPFSALIGSLRLVRVHKYRLLLKFVQRMFQAAGEWQPGPTLDARLVFGAFLPADQQATVDLVVALVQAKLITVETGLRMLVEVGVPIGDISEEIENLQADDFEGAVQLLEATGSEAAVFRRLGMNPDEAARPAPPPEVDLPQGGTLEE